MAVYKMNKISLKIKNGFIFLDSYRTPRVRKWIIEGHFWIYPEGPFKLIYVEVKLMCECHGIFDALFRDFCNAVKF